MFKIVYSVLLAVLIISFQLLTANSIFAQSVQNTKSFQINSAADDVNQVVTSFLDETNAWIGTGGSATDSYAAFRFNAVSIPKNALIISAHLKFYSISNQWIDVGYDLYGESSGSSMVFSSANMPSQRTFTTAKASHRSGVSWAADTWYDSDEIKNVVQEVVNRPDWAQDNSLSLILKGTVGTWGRKFIRSFNADPLQAVKLVITYEDTGGGVPAPVISGVNATEITPNSALINWLTDLPSDSQVEWGLTTGYGNQTTLDSTLLTQHSRALGNLEPNTIYHFRVKSGGQNGLLSISQDYTFQTIFNPQASSVGQWSSLMNWPLVAVHSALMPSGKVLMWDAWEFNQTPSATLWDPSSLSFTAAPNTTSGLFCSAQSMLSDGRQLVAGGHNGAGYGTNHTNIFNPSSNSWSQGTNMTYERWYPTTQILATGQVLVFGGERTPGVFATIPELFNPLDNSWTSLPTAEDNFGNYPIIKLLSNGKILRLSNQNKLLDPTTYTWQNLGAGLTLGPSVMYRPDKILSTGEGTSNNSSITDATTGTPAAQYTQPMHHGRSQHNLVLLPDGKVFVVGGSDNPSISSTTGYLMPEMFDPDTNAWSELVPMQNLRMYHSTALLLPDGRIMVAGGGRLAPAVDYPTAEIYSPAYLFKGSRPVITQAPGSAAYDSQINIDTPDKADIAKVSLIRFSSVTHTVNFDQNYQELLFSQTANGISATIPVNENITLPGYYMLFILNSQGIPSVAKIILIGENTLSSPSPSPVPPTPSPTPVSSPSPTPTPTPTTGEVIVTAQPTQSADDVNEVNSTVTTNSTLWLGNGESATTSFTGLRFNSLNIPQGATIKRAYLEVYSASDQWITTSYNIYAHDIGNSPVFSDSNKPSQRTLTSSFVSHSSGVHWSGNFWYQLNDISTVVQSVINKLDWNSGNSLSLVLKGTGGTWGRKYIRSYDDTPQYAPILTVVYQL